MAFQRAKSPCERPVPKPEVHIKNEDVIEDENAILEEEIEVYRDKIAIADEILKIHKQEEEETKLGANMLSKQLQKEVFQLRKQLMEALIMEKTVIHRALKSQREIQMSMEHKNANDTLAWLEDKWFEQRKKLDLLISAIYDSRKELADSESLIWVIEKFPRPGSLAWEKVCMARMVSLELMIQSMIVKKETVEILLSKYMEIKEIITKEAGSYDKMLMDAENEMVYQKSELQRMEEAQEFSAEQLEMEKLELAIAQKEITNGYTERLKIIESKKAIMEKKKPAPRNSNEASRKKLKLPYDQSTDAKNSSGEIAEIRKRIEAKQEVVQKYTKITECLTHETHVATMEEVPRRFVILLEMRKRLSDEKIMKTALLNVMIRQKDQLQRILDYLQNNGDNKRKLANKKIAEIRQKTAKMMVELKKKEHRLNRGADLTCTAKLGAMTLLKRIQDCRWENVKSPSTGRNVTPKSPFANITQITTDELARLCGDEGEATMEHFESEQKFFDSPNDSEVEVLLDDEDEPIEERLIRVETPVEERDNRVLEFEYIGSKVPDRMEIKEQSQKFIIDAIYRREKGQC